MSRNQRIHVLSRAGFPVFDWSDPLQPRFLLPKQLACVFREAGFQRLLRVGGKLAHPSAARARLMRQHQQGIGPFVPLRRLIAQDEEVDPTRPTDLPEQALAFVSGSKHGARRTGRDSHSSPWHR